MGVVIGLAVGVAVRAEVLDALLMDVGGGLIGCLDFYKDKLMSCTTIRLYIVYQFLSLFPA